MARPMPRDAPVTNATRPGDSGALTSPRSRTTPPQQRAAPGEAGAEAGAEDEVARLQTTVVGRLGEDERDRRGAGVPVAVDVHEGALRRDPEPIACGLDDTDVGLVRREPGDVVDAHARAVECVRRRLHDDAHGAAEHLLTVHAQVVLAVGD